MCLSKVTKLGPKKTTGVGYKIYRRGIKPFTYNSQFKFQDLEYRLGKTYKNKNSTPVRIYETLRKRGKEITTARYYPNGYHIYRSLKDVRKVFLGKSCTIVQVIYEDALCLGIQDMGISEVKVVIVPTIFLLREVSRE